MLFSIYFAILKKAFNKTAVPQYDITNSWYP